LLAGKKEGGGALWVLNPIDHVVSIALFLVIGYVAPALQVLKSLNMQLEAPQ
jgi:hypothetical protein